jgi:hypothetical protein
VQSRFWPLQKKIGIFPDLNPDLAGIPDFGESGIPIWPESRIREIGNPDLAGIPDSGNRESRFCRDRENKPRCPGIGDFGVWRRAGWPRRVLAKERRGGLSLAL